MDSDSTEENDCSQHRKRHELTGALQHTISTLVSAGLACFRESNRYFLFYGGKARMSTRKAKAENLRLKSAPTFQDIFGKHWDDLPNVFKKHYANHPYSNDRVTAEGILDVTCRSYMKLLRPFYRLLGSVPAMTEKNVSVTVHFDSSPDTKAFHFNRIFHFSESTPYRFQSRMLQVRGNEVIEIMRFGICWRMAYGWDGGKVTLQHKGYALNLFGHYMPLPITALIGRGDAQEIAIDDDHFDMAVTITHFIFGVVYSYAGRFKVIGAA